ncbi:glycosyltransferase [Faecalibacterium prausnitzii]|nr:glycosyltransferase [Faecalibacterium prausnitzii]
MCWGGVTNKCTIICIPRTNSPQELAAIYTTADVFVNPTYEDNYPTVNLEAQACGTRVVTYDTGGCRETLNAKSVTHVEASGISQGTVVDKG